MSRRRYISTDISTDPKVADLAEEGGAFPVLLYTWLIPHLDDWGRAPGDPKEIRLMVLPGFPCTSKDVDQALDLMQQVGLIYRYEVDGKKYICVNPETFYRHQSYIQQKKRKDDSGSKYPRPDGPWGEYFAKGEGEKSGDAGDEHHETPQNTAEQQQTANVTEQRRTSPQNTASPSPSPSPSPSKDLSSGGGEYVRAHEKADDRLVNDSNFAKAFEIFQNHFFHAVNEIQMDTLADFVDAGVDPEVIEKAAQITRANGKDLKYFWGILRNCVTRGIMTLEAFEQEQERWRVANATHWARNRGDPGTGEEDVAASGYFTSIPGLIRTV